MFHKSSSTADIGLGTWLKRLLLFIAIAAIFILGYSLGAAKVTSGTAWGTGNILGSASLDSSAQADMSTFWQVWNLAKANYVDQPVDQKKLMDGAMEGLVWSLGDPYSTYFTADQAKDFNGTLNGTFSGIGAEIGERTAGITVVAPLPDSPAAKAGVQTDDIIAAIDGKTTAGMSADEAVHLIRGDAGTTVTLTLIRGTAKPFDVAIVRADIKTKSVTWDIRKDGIAVITISVFNEDTDSLFAQAVDEMTKAKVKGLVVDLRGDPGGLLTAAIDVASYWTGDKTVVIEKFRDHENPYRGNVAAVLADIPTVVLVNGGSASASEILSGALQDYGLGTIMGETTFGKGSVQEYYDLPGGSAAKITIARWLTPKGRTIHEVGITPDIEVKETLDQIHAGSTPQMDAAIGHLTQK